MMFDRVCSGENLHYLIRAAVIRMSDIALMIRHRFAAPALRVR